MPPSGNFGSVELEGEQLRAIGNVIELEGCESASLHVAIVQDGQIVHGPATTSGSGWATGPLPAPGFHAGDALGLASQTLVTVSDGTLPSFATVTWSENVVIAGKGE